ncbi:hypothetical protein [Micromonospora sp. IBHARD004]|uniref:hypothetical protein n=1 Tax=Micromonospora sp. IBHARD004 TaxID=3457764 RepID=UPI0040582472
MAAAGRPDQRQHARGRGHVGAVLVTGGGHAGHHAISGSRPGARSLPPQCHAESKEQFRDLPGWDRYAAAHWLNLRRWLDDNPDDELAGELRRELTEDPVRHVRYRREYLGWGVFALLRH